MNEAQSPHILHVAAATETTPLAGSLTETLKEHGSAELHAIGAAAVNQAAKAIAVSRGHLAANGLDSVTVPAFFDTTIDGKEMTGLKFIVRLKQGY